jgi:hypothetical protein
MLCGSVRTMMCSCRSLIASGMGLVFHGTWIRHRGI